MATVGHGNRRRCWCSTCNGELRHVSNINKHRHRDLDDGTTPIRAPTDAETIVDRDEEEEEVVVPPRPASPLFAPPRPASPRGLDQPPALPVSSGQDKIVMALLLQLLDKKARHNETEESFVATLLIIKSTFSTVLDPSILHLLPDTWLQTMSRFKDVLPTYTIIHSCPKECMLYRNAAASLTRCLHCKSPRYKPDSTQPIRAMHHFSLIDRLRTRFTSAAFAEELLYPHTRHAPPAGEAHDVQDGSLWREFAQADRFGESKYNIALSLSSDGFSLDANKTRSLIPLIATILNLPPWLRGRFAAQLLLATLPEGANKVQLYLEPLLDELKLLQAAAGVRMWNAHAASWVTVRATILFDMNDIVGAPKISSRRSGGSIHSPCHICDILGQHVKQLGCRVFTGCFRDLPEGHELR
jgi:hypothetical protein